MKHQPLLKRKNDVKTIDNFRLIQVLREQQEARAAAKADGKAKARDKGEQ